MGKRPQVWLEVTHLLVSPTGNKSGIGYYTENVIRALTQVKHGYDFQLVGNLFAATPVPDFIKALGLPTRVSRIFPGKVWNQAFKRGIMPPINYIHRGRPDLVVNFNFVRYPVSEGIKTITFIHDLAYEKFPEHVEEKNLQYLRKFVPIAARDSDRLIAISEATKNDVVQAYGVSKAKIDIVYGAVDPKRYQAKFEEKQIRTKYELPEKYIFFIGNNEPRKNLVNLIRAFCSLDENKRDSHKLVIAGSTGWKNEELDAVFVETDVLHKVLRLGYVDDADVPALYRLSTCFVFPSFYEGFGLPILEAMASATPVLTSRVSSMPEVGSDAALYIDDPLDVPVIAKQISRLIADDRLRQKLKRMGLNRVESFSWSKSAEQLLRSIDRVGLE